MYTIRYSKVEILRNPGMARGNTSAPHLNGIRSVAAPRVARHMGVQIVAI
ncbi:MAG: hypothetical protein HCAMLNBO_00252 [Candidatus Brocadia fulgida]|nr:hypothetical protein [Candidatus Brocadia fulgida]